MIRRTAGRKLALVALASLFALGLAACGSDDDGNAADTTTTEAEETGSDTIKITYKDYAYEVSGPLTAGGTIELENAGKEFHMMGVVKLKRGKTLKDVQSLLKKFSEEDSGDSGSAEETTTTQAASTATTTADGGGEEEDPFAELGDDPGLPGNVMAPGAAVAVTLPDLEPGTYAMMCFIPGEGDGAPHFTKGMINEFKVVEGDAPAPPTADATYKVAKGKAVEGPATLTAGEHTIKFEGVGDASELEPGFGRANPGTTFAQFNKALSDLFESDAPPPKGAAAKVPGELTFAGFDLRGINSYYVTATFEPGTYFVVAEDSDDEDDPDLPKELIQIKVS
jgi:hypothetical protein